MKVLVLGASGATGRLVVRQLVERELAIRIVIRKTSSMPEDLMDHPQVDSVVGNLTEFDSEQYLKLVDGCDVVVCCLGHNMTFKGIFGSPRLLVYQSLKKACEAIRKQAKQPVKIILMNTTGNINKDIQEHRSLAERMVISLLTAVLPPQRDNVYAAHYLRTALGKNNSRTEWVVVRPDSLIDHEAVSPYDVVEAPTRSPIFNAGKTSRINVSHFMAELVTNHAFWDEWKYRMPVLYNK